MPALFNALRWFFQGIIGSAIYQILYKYGPAIIALGFIIAGIITVLTLYLSSMFSIVQGIYQTIPSLALDVWGWVMPSNAVPCLLAILSARVWSWLTKIGYDVLKIKSKAV
ncbi:DUF5455 family protein [Methylomonas rapida]|uniref:DUF5455 family protein n=1 Tax=Methylomonas rapida TaxID=2963939 RepID=A0ABY7GH35_9GAMM|nr:DUF5455 family protein [Methylomonas rapida]WAR44570.1 DUF5455 family protein [Methylomonas rapida]